MKSWLRKFRSTTYMYSAVNKWGCSAMRRAVSVCSPTRLASSAAARIARPARAVASTIRTSGNGLSLPSSAVPEEPNAARLASVSATRVWQPSRAATRSPCHRPAGSVAATTGPATRSNRARIASTPRYRRHFVTTLAEGTCQDRAHGRRGRTPTICANAST